MALLAKKLSFLPFAGSKTVRPFMATYVSVSPVALRRNRTNQSLVVSDEDRSSSVEDEVVNVQMNGDQEAILADDDIDDFPESVPCRVMTPARRAWATSEDENSIRFRMDMPGVAKENVKVYLDNMKLVVKGKYSQLEEAHDEDHVLADNVGVYTAEVMLPENVEAEKIKSEMKDGMLLVTAPKEVRHIPVD